MISIPSLSSAEAIKYKLSLKFDLNNSLLSGIANIIIPAGDSLTLETGDIDITQITASDNASSQSTYSNSTNQIIIKSLANNAQEFNIYFNKTTNNFSPYNRINSKGIVLTSNWYPLPNRDVFFSLSAQLPKDFKAISESDIIDLEPQDNYANFKFSQPTQSINFIAAEYDIQKLQIRDDLFVSTWLFKEDAYLSKRYLQATAAYILKYEKEFGEFPYNHYAIVENRLPTGFGMPGFTLLGQAVIRLPFIISTSLGHEIVHSWFGNSISIAENSGNWCEGLTSYVADFSFQEEKGKGREHRKNSILNFLNHTSSENIISLNDFHSASHHQSSAKAVRAVGYNKGAMFFHELKTRLGAESFKQGLRHFYQTHKGQKASWLDLQQSFQLVSEKDLSSFFSERLNRTDIPSISLDNLTVNTVENNTLVSFDIIQHNEEPYSTLLLPITLYTNDGIKKFIKEINSKEQRITIALDSRPFKISLDQEYSFMRSLEVREKMPVVSQLDGSRKGIAIVEEQDHKKFADFISYLKTKKYIIKNSNQVTNQELGENNIVYLGTDNKAAKILLGTTMQKSPGFWLDIQQNPLNENKFIAILHTSNQSECAKAVRKLRHYGKYSNLHFLQGKIQSKETKTGINGITADLDSLPSGGATKDVSTFADIINQLADDKIVYIGERHNSMADHLLQFRIIEALYKKDTNLAIGMEMFPTSSQKTLDDYTIHHRSTEKEFLKDSNYFNVWRYDWRYYRDIFNFARKNKIKIIGLNIKRAIVSKIFKDGHTDNLTKDEINSLPQERDLTIEGYAEQLRKIHGFHNNNKADSGKISGFVQSQGLWDESMAANISSFIKTSPNDKIIVLAGSQHTRKDYGIPPRVARRITTQQASILNINETPNPDISKVADYFFLSEPISLPELGKIGIIIGTSEDKSTVFIEDISAKSNASEAGLKKEDILISINDYPVASMADVKISMLDAYPGDEIEVQIQRKNTETEEYETKAIKVKLYNPAMVH